MVGLLASVASTTMAFQPVVLGPKQTSSLAMGSNGEGSPMNIIIAGAPGSGKGTQCESISEEFGVVHLSTGDMLREAAAAGSDIGIEAKGYIDSGKLMPDKIVTEIIMDRLQAKDCKTRGWILDGFPSTAVQAMALANAGVSPDCFLYLDVPEDVLMERDTGRRTDPKTGKIYHMKFSPPPSDDQELMDRLVYRIDDQSEETVATRLKEFNTNADAVKSCYDDIMVNIDGNRSPSDVTKDVLEGIKSVALKEEAVAA